MELNDLNNITVTSKNVSQLASIAIELKLPEDTPVRKNIKNWYLEHSPEKDKIKHKLKSIQRMLDNGYSKNSIAQANNISRNRILVLIREGKLRNRDPWELRNA